MGSCSCSIPRRGTCHDSCPPSRRWSSGPRTRLPDLRAGRDAPPRAGAWGHDRGPVRCRSSGPVRDPRRWAVTAAPLPERGYGLPHDVSVDGFRVDELIHFTMAAITVIFVVVAAALIWSFVKHRSGPALYSHGTRCSIGLVVGAVALVLFGVDGNLFIHTLGD